MMASENTPNGQIALKPYWDEEDQDLVVLPSLTFDVTELSKIAGLINYEERLLYHILHLSHPKTRIIYVSSMPLDPEIISYYLSLLPTHLTHKDISNRLHLFSVHDASPHCLAQKLLRRPRLIGRIRQVLRPGRARLQVYRRTMFEKKVADELGLEFPAASPEAMRWGTKCGSRRAFKEAGIWHAAGTYTPAMSVEDLVEGILGVVRENGDNARMGMVKLDESFAGMGNALIDLGEVRELVAGGDVDGEKVRDAIMGALENMTFESGDESWNHFQKGIETIGAIFELFIPKADGQTTPSAQGYISENGLVTILSSHEQVMDGRHYIGCSYPTDQAYQDLLIRNAKAVGDTLSKYGVVGHFGVDFIATPPQQPSQNQYTVQALEINIRATGTTFPLMSLLLLTHSTPETTTKHYITTDHFGFDSLKALTPGDIPDIVAKSGYAWRHDIQKGAVVYMMGGIAELGTFGAMFVGDSVEECREMMNGFKGVFEQEGRRWRKMSDEVPEDSFSVLVGSVVGSREDGGEDGIDQRVEA